MSTKIVKQLNPSIANLPYPTTSSSFGGNGCGCCACYHIAIEQPWKEDLDINTLRLWMIKQGFAVPGKGTLWSGINETLKHIGHKTVVWIDRDDPMSKAWKELNKGNRIGVLLVSDGATPDGTEWTSSGHYVAFTKYKLVNGQHKFYIKDSGFRNHDGWFTYEKSLKGALPQMWIVERIEIKATKYRPSTPYTGTLPKITVKRGTKSQNVVRLKKFLNWCINANLSLTKQAGEITDKAIRKFQKTYGLVVDGIFGAESKKTALEIIKAHELTPQKKMCAWAKKIAGEKYHYVRWKEGIAKTHTCPICTGREYDDNYGGNCIWFAWASWHHGAGLPSRCSCSVFTNAHYNKMMQLGANDALKLARERIGLNDILVYRSATGFDVKDLEAGDVVAYFDKSGYVHTALCVGNGKIADCTSTRSDGIMYGVDGYTKWKIKIVFRYIGK